MTTEGLGEMFEGDSAEICAIWLRLSLAITKIVAHALHKDHDMQLLNT
jgi:hypothetical protein